LFFLIVSDSQENSNSLWSISPAKGTLKELNIHLGEDFYMKKLSCLLFLLMSAGAALILTFLISVNSSLAHLPLENDELAIQAGDLGESLYLLETKPKSYDGRFRVFFYHLTFDNAKDLSLYLANGEGASLIINGESLPVTSDSYMLSLAAFDPGETDFRIFVSYTLNGERSFATPILAVGRSDAVSSVHYYGTYQRIFIIAFSLAILVFCLCLFLQKRSERYLLWLALMVYSTASRTSLNAFPAWKQVPVLNELLLGTIRWPGLPVSVCANINMVLLDLMLAYIHYRLMKEFIPVTLGRRPYYRYSVPLFAVALCLAGRDTWCYNFLIASLTVTFLLEAWIIARAFPGRIKHCLIFSLAWMFTVSTRYFLFGNRLHLIADGLVNIQWRFRGLIETFYALAFVIVISGKFAHKFSEAENMASELEQLVDRKTAELKESLHKLEALQKQKDEFVSNIVHSIKTPLFTLGGYADMIDAELEETPEKAREHLARLNETADYANLLVNNLLLVMRLEDRHVDFDPTEGDLRGLLREIQNASSLIAEKKGIRFLCSLPDLPLTVSCDFFYMRQAIQNIVDNALLHCGEGDMIRLSACVSEGWNLITIQDSGPGIAPEVLPHIFDRYYSGASVRPSGLSGQSSSGIGLTISREIVQQHGGSVQAESEWGHGCVFTIRLPLS
jgi:signal transduction histidine kinase